MIVTAGIVLYNPEINILKSNLDILTHQVEYIILIDNSSDNILEIENTSLRYNNIILIKNKINEGIAVALNQIVTESYHKKAEWTLLLDQDSEVPDGMTKCFNGLTSIDKMLAVISPKIIDVNDNSSFDITQKGYVYIKKCITSGSFVNIGKCIELGLFDMRMFIDIVDFEYCIRVINAGYKIIKVNDIILNHRLGDLKVKKIMGLSIYVTNHSRVRVYYYSRNLIYVLKKHKGTVRLLETFSCIIKKFIKIAIFEQDKLWKIRFLVKGVNDGIKGKMGKFDF